MNIKLHLGKMHNRLTTILLRDLSLSFAGKYEYQSIYGAYNAGLRRDLFALSTSEDCALLRRCRLNWGDSEGRKGRI